MEVVLGFAVGYWIGTRQGRQGLQQALDNVQAIMASPESRRLLSEGLAALEEATGPVLRRLGGKSGRTSTATILGSVVDELLERRHARTHAA